MPRESFQAELEALQADVVGMGEHVLAQLDDALTALETADAELASDVIDGDDAVNERYLDLEARCVDLFALQQPVASDLRFVAAAFKILTDLERVGDLATNLGQYALAAGDGTVAADGAAGTASSAVDVPPESVTEIGRDAEAMLQDALDAFETENAEVCPEIAARDDELDVLCQHAGEDVVRQLLSAGTAATDTDPPTEWDVEQALDDVSRVLLTIRDLERVGDHAVNVAARTLYMVEHDPTLVV
ncbi:phosphate signaling complex protein PhoU [Salinarchaeum sp. Harcht-Bsk1]|uniref:phosphate signaling complex protein PhoU n=1 Tax=Salinarchaeum sp. Harcht-Bsk1 TaxID=1333523 RepID=UPI0006780748|nr:phosphate signaling complex protein PhoU [Salinarchaeum sp. Harcht-Bsk1]